MKTNNRQRGSVDWDILISFGISIGVIVLIVGLITLCIGWMVEGDNATRATPMYVVYREDGYQVEKWKVPWGDLDIGWGDQTKWGDEEVSFVSGKKRMVLKGYLSLTKPGKKRIEAVELETLGDPGKEDATEYSIAVYPVAKKERS